LSNTDDGQKESGMKVLHTVIQKFGISKIFFKEINTFIQGCIKCIKSDRNNI